MTEQGRLGPPESCAADRPARAPGTVRASWPRLSYDAFLPPSPATQVADEDSAPDPTISSSPLRPVRRRRPHNVVAPPYDVIDEERRAELVARHPANVVRLDLPAEEAGDEPDERYRRAARTLAAWRSDGTFRKDPHPSIYIYDRRTACRARPPSVPSAGSSGGCGSSRSSPARPCCRTNGRSGPKEDRYKLLRATGVNTSPVVALYRDVGGRSAQLLTS